MIQIDGAAGEGGGQIIRTSLALSLTTGQGFEIDSIRANRSPPGLRPQHLAAVELAGHISNARIEGAEISASQLRFSPDQIKSGSFTHKIHTAGSACLLLQTVVLPLALRPKKSNVLAAGGTHVPFSPSFTYLQHTWLNILSKLGFQVRVNLIKAGYFPQGGGEISCRISPTSEIDPIILLSKGELVRIRGYSTVSHLNLDIARRMKHQILERLQPLYRNTKIITQELPSPGAGAHCCIIAEYENSTQTFSSLGKKGKRAEIVADEAVDAFLSYHWLPGVLDQYSADQIVLPLAIAGGESRFTTTKLTSHLITNIEVIKKFLDCDILITGAVNEPGEVFVKPATNY